MNSSKSRLIHIGLAAILLCPVLAGCVNTTNLSTVKSPSTSVTPLTLLIISPQDSETFNSNLQKVSGIVSDPTSVVTVNGTEAYVSQDGSFFGYADLPKGESVISVIATRRGNAVSRELTVAFISH